MPSGYDTYRAYRFVWYAEPDTEPVATAQRQSDGATIVHAIWNGATEVAHWDVLSGPGRGRASEGEGNGRQRVASVAWNGLDTTIAVNASLTSVRIIARDRAGREIGRSAVTAVSP